MTTNDHIANSFETSGISPPAQAAPEQKEVLTSEERKQHRTTGLKLFDIFLYPLLTNFVVFGASVGITYLTRHGGARPDGSLPHGKFGAAMSKRNTDLIKGFEKLGLREEHAKTGSMVFWSFFDGTLIAPLVKVFEDRREKIGKWVDDRLGTTPANLKVYEAEPKQTWGTVLSGRLATAAIVLPTAIAFEKAGLHKGFERWGRNTTKWLETSKPKMYESLSKKISDLPDFFRVSYFEGIYTTVCTAGLYFVSRAFARRHDAKTGRVEIDPVSHEKVVHTASHQHARPEQREDSELTSPSTQINAAQVQSRVSAPVPELAQGA